MIAKCDKYLKARGEPTAPEKLWKLIIEVIDFTGMRKANIKDKRKKRINHCHNVQLSSLVVLFALLIV